ncbi:D-aminoacyl-tRNA deacylase [Marinobacter sp. 1Y8]
MKGLIQRVVRADVSVGGQSVGQIDRGLLLFVGVERNDTPSDATDLCQRILHYRVFPDGTGRMNHSLLDIGASLLVVPQFTLAADTRKGQRPGFSAAASPDHGRALFDVFVAKAAEQLPEELIATGQFGADMAVSLVNDGPVTFLLESRK